MFLAISLPGSSGGHLAPRPGSGFLRDSLMYNQATYRAGRKSSVSNAATTRPPMVAQAIGSPKTSEAIGHPRRPSAWRKA